MNVNTLLIFGAIVVAGYLIFTSKKPLDEGESISADSTKAGAEEMGLVNKDNPAPADIVSNKPFGSQTKGADPPIPFLPKIKVPGKDGMSVTPKGIIPTVGNAAFAQKWASLPTTTYGANDNLPKTLPAKQISTNSQPTLTPTSRLWI